MSLYPNRSAPLGAGGDTSRRDASSSPPSTGPDDGQVVDEETASRAAAILAAHHPGADGWCAECLQTGIMTFAPCAMAVWAGRVREAVTDRLGRRPAPDTGVGSGRTPDGGADPGGSGVSGGTTAGGDT